MKYFCIVFQNLFNRWPLKRRRKKKKIMKWYGIVDDGIILTMCEFLLFRSIWKWSEEKLFIFIPFHLMLKTTLCFRNGHIITMGFKLYYVCAHVGERSMTHERYVYGYTITARALIATIPKVLSSLQSH